MRLVPILGEAFVSSRRAGLCYILIYNLTCAVVPLGMAAHFLESKQFKCAGDDFFCALLIINSIFLRKKQTIFFKTNLAKNVILSGSGSCQELRPER